MTRVGDCDGISIYLYRADHGAPHIHGRYQGKDVKVFIATLHVEGGGLSPNQMKKLKKWIKVNEGRLMRLWSDMAAQR